MPDPRAARIDVGPFHLAPTPNAGTWTALARRGTGTGPGQSGGAPASGITAADDDGEPGSSPHALQQSGDSASGITASWADWVAFAHRVVQADALWREVEARGDAWDEGFGAARDAAAVNPYR